MAKKNFKSGLENLFKENFDEIKNANGSNDKKDEKIELSGISLDDITDEKLKWLLIKIQRYEKELKLWRTGKLSTKEFENSLKKFNLTYNSETNEIEIKS